VSCCVDVYFVWGAVQIWSHAYKDKDKDKDKDIIYCPIKAHLCVIQYIYIWNTNIVQLVATE